jgi:tetratricopeptide (TPR) repeat protein
MFNPVESKLAKWSFLVLAAAGIALTIAVHAARLPTGARGYYNRGVDDTRKGHYKEAIANLDRSLELEPDRTDARIARANAYLKSDRLFLALSDADAAVEMSPDSPYALYVRGLVLHRLGREDEAFESFNRACAADPKFARGALARADALFDSGNFSLALEAYRGVCTLRRRDATLAFAPMLVWASRTLTGDRAGAEGELRDLLRSAIADRGRLWPLVDAATGTGRAADPEGAWIEGVKSLSSGDRAAAIASFRRAVAGERDSWARERSWEALVTLTLGVRVQPDDPEISSSLSFGPGLTITCVRDRSGASAVGIRPGDRLLEVNGEAASAARLDAQIARGAVGSVVRLELRRAAEPVTATIVVGQAPAVISDASAPTR